MKGGWTENEGRGSSLGLQTGGSPNDLSIDEAEEPFGLRFVILPALSTAGREVWWPQPPRLFLLTDTCKGEQL